MLHCTQHTSCVHCCCSSGFLPPCKSYIKQCLHVQSPLKHVGHANTHSTTQYANGCGNHAGAMCAVADQLTKYTHTPTACIHFTVRTQNAYMQQLQNICQQQLSGRIQALLVPLCVCVCIRHWLRCWLTAAAASIAQQMQQPSSEGKATAAPAAAAEPYTPLSHGSHS